jgi:cobalt-zinc-cadmium efflux system membrane fusion protein
MKPGSFVLSVFSFLLLSSCHSSTTEEKKSDPEPLIEITANQFNTEEMKLGESLRTEFDELVNCHGNIISKPGGLARISAPISGYIRKIYFTPGEKVAKGQVIFEIGGNEVIELQKDFSETSSMLMRVKSEYERLKSLYSENVGTEKEFIMAQSEYKVTQARHSALMMKIAALGLDPASVESGKFSDAFLLRSPLTGYLSVVNVSLGQYSTQESTLAEVFDPSQLVLRIAVFEKDIFSLSEGQKLVFRIIGDKNEYSATIKLLGKSIDNDTKTILSYADIDDISQKKFINNTYVEARVITSRDSVNAVPEEAILKSGEDRYVLAFVRQENDIYYFRKLKVTTGRSINGLTEVTNEVDGQILLKGAYNLILD